MAPFEIPVNQDIIKNIEGTHKYLENIGGEETRKQRQNESIEKWQLSVTSALREWKENFEKGLAMGNLQTEFSERRREVDFPITLFDTMDDRNPRALSLQIKEGFKYGAESYRGHEDSYAQETRKCLADLLSKRKDGEVTFFDYATEDILEGLESVDHPPFQMIIAEQLGHPNNYVRQKAKKLLLESQNELNKETLSYIIRTADMPDFVFSLLEQKKSCGYVGEEILSDVQEFLEAQVGSHDEKYLIRGAKTALLLNEKTQGGLPMEIREYIVDTLKIQLETVIRNWSNPIAFQNQVRRRIHIYDEAERNIIQPDYTHVTEGLNVKVLLEQFLKNSSEEPCMKEYTQMISQMEAQQESDSERRRIVSSRPTSSVEFSRCDLRKPGIK